jgi:hypothetical protein
MEKSKMTLRFEGASNGKWGPNLEGNRYDVSIRAYIGIK